MLGPTRAVGRPIKEDDGDEDCMMQSPKQRVPYRALLKDMIYGAVEKVAR